MAWTVVLGYDGSSCAKNALARTADIVRDGLVTKVVVVCAFESSVGYAFLGMKDSPLLKSAEYENHLDLLKKNGEAVVSSAADELEAAGATVERAIVDAQAVDALLAAAKEHKADLVVVGSHGHGAMTAAFVGSTALKLVHNGEVPVMVVPPHGTC
jgi:nucleotide-binding universal stress UspA family protein